jgi:hypothetical protein
MTGVFLFFGRVNRVGWRSVVHQNLSCRVIYDDSAKFSMTGAKPDPVQKVESHLEPLQHFSTSHFHHHRNHHRNTYSTKGTHSPFQFPFKAGSDYTIYLSIP